MAINIINITVIVPTKNEEKNISRCLKALQNFSEVVVLDSCSSDKTQEIAEKLGAKVVEFSWNGEYPKKRNWYLDNYTPLNEWVLFVDADEILTESFKEELIENIKRDDIYGYWLKYENYFLGTKLRFGIQQRKLALFRHRFGRYEKINDLNWTQLDMEVHEHPIIKGKTRALKSRIIHNDYKSIKHFYLKHINYAEWEAKRYLSLTKDRQQKIKYLNFRQSIKYKLITSYWFAPSYFCINYFFLLGFLDGKAGFSYSVAKTWYFNLIYRLINEDSLC